MTRVTKFPKKFKQPVTKKRSVVFARQNKAPEIAQAVLTACSMIENKGSKVMDCDVIIKRMPDNTLAIIVEDIS